MNLERRSFATCLLSATLVLSAGCKEGDVDFFDDGGLEDAAAGAGGAGRGGAGGRPAPEDDAGTERDAAAADAGPPPDPATPEGWPAALAGALCDALESCYGSADQLVEALNGRDCTGLNTNELRNGELRYLPDSVEAGLVAYDPDELSDCLSAIRALGCDVRSQRLPASCELLIAGTVALGDACTIDEDCTGDAFCAKETAATCPGTCTALLSEGMPCRNSDDDQCEDGLTCLGSSGECVPFGELGDACAADSPCKPGLLCQDLGTGLECVSQSVIYARQEGEDCEPGSLCEPGLVCVGIDAETGMCMRKVGEGAPCRQALPKQCPTSQYCSAEDVGQIGSCTDLPGDGEPCLLDRNQLCADGHVCVESTDTCEARKQIGERCIIDEQCYSGSCEVLDAYCEAPVMCDAP